MRILIVEDDEQLGRIVKDLLTKDGYICDVATNIEHAHKRLDDKEEYDLILLDLMLPDGDGVEFCNDIRNSGISTPILMLTSKNKVTDRVDGLDAGADDYLPKPFSPNELKARIRALLRRPKQSLGEEISCGDLTLNTLSRTVKKNGETVQLMPKEYSLLEYLLRKKSEVVRKEELLRHVWGVYSRTSSNRLEVYIRYLREKIDIPYSANMIQTVRGTGYKITDD